MALHNFYRRVIIQSAIIMGTTVLVLVFSLLIGLPLLSFVYDIDLSSYKLEFIMMLVGGALYALEYYLTIPVMIIQEQSKLAYAYVIAILVSLFCQKAIVHGYGLLGVAYLYILINLLSITV